MITINANAKINLTLDVLAKRDDGYHEVSMVMQSIALCDKLTLVKHDDNKQQITLHGDVRGVEKPEDNLAYKAADLFLRTYKIPHSVDINLEKRIPVAAGLAGGSTDAGAVLRGLNILFNTQLPVDELCTLGAKLGSDIPFCIKGGTMLAEGRGEILTSLPVMPKIALVLVKPKIDVSTAWVYKNYDKLKSVSHPDNQQMKNALANKNLTAICQNLGNVLENVTIPEYPQIAKIKQLLCNYGALSAMMSGSGPTVFAIAENETVANSIAEKITAALKSENINIPADVFVTTTTGENIDNR